MKYCKYNWQHPSRLKVHLHLLFFVLFQPDYNIADNYCGTHDFNTPIAGNRAVTSEAAAFFPKESTTSIAVTTTHKYTVAYIGTAKGKVYKVRVFFLFFKGK